MVHVELYANSPEQLFTMQQPIFEWLCPAERHPHVVVASTCTEIHLRCDVIIALLLLRRYFDPAPYQVLQELQLRSARGEAVDAEVALQPSAVKPSRSRMDLASRLRLRKERQRQGRIMYSGFVPPYNTQSRVFDANELRRAATQVGWGRSCWCACIRRVLMRTAAEQTKVVCALECL
jgi:hypothetical protein